MKKEFNSRSQSSEKRTRIDKSASKPPYSKDRSFDKPSKFGNTDKPRSFDKPDSKFGDKRSFDKPSSSRFGEKRSTPDSRFGDKRTFDKSDTRFGDKRNFDKPYAEKRSFDKPDSRFGDKRTTDRPDSRFGEKRGTDRPDSRFGEKRSFDKPDSRFGDIRNSDRPDSRFGDKRNSDRPDSRFGDKRSFDKPESRFGDKRNSENESEGKFRNFASKSDTIKPNSNYSKQVGLARQPDFDDESLMKKLPAKVIKKLEGEAPKSDDIRLNRFIANAGLCSRREADEFIASGQITVNGQVITEMGYKVKPTDMVKYGRKILNREKLVYVLLNKPKDFITTTDDPEGRRTVMELIKNAAQERIYPVGRLDRSTTGLLLFTNDGELADKLSHPSNEIRKIYQVELNKKIEQEDFDKILEGLELEDGSIKVDDLSVITPDGFVLGIEIHSGKNRIVRRIFEHLGYEVTKLDRTTYAGLNKKDLPRGNWRYLTEKEVIRLKFLL